MNKPAQNIVFITDSQRYSRTGGLHSQFQPMLKLDYKTTSTSKVLFASLKPLLSDPGNRKT